LLRTACAHYTVADLKRRIHETRAATRRVVATLPSVQRQRRRHRIDTRAYAWCRMTSVKSSADGGSGVAGS
jgi:hypothetical protein